MGQWFPSKGANWGPEASPALVTVSAGIIGLNPSPPGQADGPSFASAGKMWKTQQGEWAQVL